LILYLIGKIGADGATYKAWTFSGPGVANITMPQRLTSSNMAVGSRRQWGFSPPMKFTIAFFSPDRAGLTHYMPIQADDDAV